MDEPLSVRPALEDTRLNTICLLTRMLTAAPHCRTWPALITTRGSPSSQVLLSATAFPSAQWQLREVALHSRPTQSNVAKLFFRKSFRFLSQIVNRLPPCLLQCALAVACDSLYCGWPPYAVMYEPLN